MDYPFFDDSKHGATINPADLHTADPFAAFGSGFDTFCPPADASNFNDLTTVDSAVDLATQWTSPLVKQEPDHFVEQFVNYNASPTSGANTPSPPTDMIFSNTNSPGDFLREHSQTASPESENDVVTHDAKCSPTDGSWDSVHSTSQAILIPQPRDTPQVHLVSDKTKTRAETQIKMQLTLDPLEPGTEYIHFPRKTLAKPKHFATPEEKEEIESKGDVTYMDVLLVCATAVEKPEDLQIAFRRAAGKERVPRRAAGSTISELDKDDPAHPQNGGEVIICEGCKERERKRYDRKKKRAEDEKEWTDYENDRVVMINEKEYKKWKEVESHDQQFSARAKTVEFAMRIACYCRHQEEKSPVGYRVLFTFKDAKGALLAQHHSEIFQITDDHKNKEVLPEAAPRPLTIPQTYMPQYGHASNVVPVYQYPVDNQFSAALATYSQPPTPVMSGFQSNPMSPMDTAFSQMTTSTATPQPHRQSISSFPSTSVSSSAPQFPRHQHHQSQYDAPMLSPTTQVPAETQYLHRPLSMDSFNFSADTQYPNYNGFASAPGSTINTPHNLSRPASPSWPEGPTKKKTIRCVYFFVDE
ncbi:hypothetical protein BU26DRAFT_437374 [Trematosphaeria pertusa]|uniref:SPT23/MGA2-like DNA-binding domain-containing protein n=1 Tax=Trematosphaeria pertusa TaxID=390896 RepID=A0A6A6HZA8_9PLEO|nr:uncharacterized protein BU26DRAFT_437374 [Trematosphaeria pertusa]KAF2243239.1 hypothetical protein BU26DRAFT_437374 [Trematosphaeria pertusa]